MNTNREITLPTSGYTRHSEFLALILLTVVLIGQIFFTQGDATLLNTELVLLGGILGIIVSCAKTPIYNSFMRRSKVNTEWQWFKNDSQATAEIHSMESKDSQPKDTNPADSARKAA